MILVVNKVDRPDARIAEVVHEVEELFLDLDADVDQLDFPIVYCESRAGRASLERPADGAGLPEGTTCVRWSTSCSTRPGADLRPDGPLQALVTNLDASPYVGRLALLRHPFGPLKKGQHVAWCRADGTIERAKLTELYVTEALDRGAVRGRRPGRDRGHRRHPRDHHRRDARRPRRSATVAGHHHRRAQPVDDHRHQHLAAGRAGGRSSSPPAR